MTNKKVRKIKIKKATPIDGGVARVELEAHNAPPLPTVPIPEEAITLPLPPDAPEEHRHWYDWIVKAVA